MCSGCGRKKRMKPERLAPPARETPVKRASNHRGHRPQRPNLTQQQHDLTQQQRTPTQLQHNPTPQPRGISRKACPGLVEGYEPS